MDFRVIGEEKVYPSVRHRPAVALSLNFSEVDRNRPASYDTFFGTPLPRDKLESQPMPEEDVEYFGQMIDPSFTLAPIGPSLGTHKSGCNSLLATV
jgi:hypothetical protein